MPESARSKPQCAAVRNTVDEIKVPEQNRWNVPSGTWTIMAPTSGWRLPSSAPNVIALAWPVVPARMPSVAATVTTAARTRLPMSSPCLWSMTARR